MRLYLAPFQRYYHIFSARDWVWPWEVLHYQKDLKLQATCAFRFMCKYIIDNTRGISRGMGDRKVSVNQSGMQGHSMSLVMASYDFLLVFRLNYVSILYRFWYIITYFQKCKEITWACTSRLLLSMNQQKKIKVPSFTDSNSKDIAGERTFLKLGHVALTTPIRLGSSLSSQG